MDTELTPELSDLLCVKRRTRQEQQEIEAKYERQRSAEITYQTRNKIALDTRTLRVRLWLLRLNACWWFVLGLVCGLIVLSLLTLMAR